MTDIQEHFTLDPQYEDFVLGMTPLPSFPIWEMGCIGAILIVVTVFGFWAMWAGANTLHKNILASPDISLLETTGQEALAQIIDCSRTSVKNLGSVPVLTYTYLWDDVRYTRTETLYKGGDYKCDKYLDGGIAIRLLPSNPNLAYVIGNTPPKTISLGEILSSVIMIVFCGLVGFFSLILLFMMFYSYRRTNRLRHARFLLLGTIVKVTGEMKSLYKSSEIAYHVTLTYEFETPRKRLLKGTHKVIRRDLRSYTLPPIGTPVSILYADNHAHMVL